MKQIFHLQPSVWHKGPLFFEWDSETGMVSGTDAEIVRALVEKALAAGSVAIHPHPARYPIADPFTRPDEMAALLGGFWKLPLELADYYPRVSQSPESIQAVDESGQTIAEITVQQ